MGAQLLQRTTRQVSLTEVGLSYYQQCKQTLRELEEAEAAIASSKEEATGILRITSSQYFAEHNLLPRQPEFMVGNPKLRIDFELVERIPDNDSGAIRTSAIRGIGIAKLHDYVVADALRDEQLVEILSEYQKPKIPIYLYYQQSRYLLPKIRRFIDFYTRSMSSISMR